MTPTSFYDRKKVYCAHGRIIKGGGREGFSTYRLSRPHEKLSCYNLKSPFKLILIKLLQIYYFFNNHEIYSYNQKTLE